MRNSAAVLLLSLSGTAFGSIESIVGAYDVQLVRFDVIFTEPTTFGQGWTFQLFIDADDNPLTGYGDGFELLVRGVELADPSHIYLLTTQGTNELGGWGPQVAEVWFSSVADRYLAFEVLIGTSGLADGSFRYTFETYYDNELRDQVQNYQTLDCETDTSGDCDADGDGLPDRTDSAPDDPYVCRDSDNDGCDDCSTGVFDPPSDGPDADGDGVCDFGDVCPGFDDSIDSDCDAIPDGCDSFDDGASPDAGLLTDPGFECAGQGWAFVAAADRSVVTAVSHSGRQALQFDVHPQYAREVYQDVPVTGGGCHSATVWVRTQETDGSGVRVSLIWLDAVGLGWDVTGHDLRTDVLGSLLGTNDWTGFFGTFSAPASAVAVRPYLFAFSDPDGSGSAWFDDVNVWQLAGFGDYTGDCEVDLNDLGGLCFCLGGPDPGAGPYDDQCGVFDFDDSGLIDLRDVARFQAGFMQPAP